MIYEIIKEPLIPGDLKRTFGKEYDGKPFVDIGKEGLVLPNDDENKRRVETEKAKHHKLCKFMKDSLNEKIEKVRRSFNCRLFSQKFAVDSSYLVSFY